MMKKIIAIVMCIMLVCSIVTTVSADETTEYITFDLREAGATAILFGTATEFNAVAEVLKATEAYSNAAEEYLINYITECQNISSTIRPYKPKWMLMKEGFEEIRSDDGLIYSYTTENSYKGKIPFNITTDVGEPNGLNLGAYHRTAQSLNLNSDKNLSALYVYTVVNGTPTISGDITYTDGTSQPISATPEQPIYSNVIADKCQTGIWGEGAYLRYEFKYSSGAYAETGSGNDGNKRFANIMEIPVQAAKKIKSVSFKLDNQWAMTAIIGITGQVATAEEIASGNLAALKAKYADASAITISNYEDVKALLDTLNTEYISDEDVKYIESLVDAVNAFDARVDSVIEKYDYIDFEKNIGLAANIGDTANVTTWNKELSFCNYALNIAAINNKKVKGYTFSDNNIPFEIKGNEDGKYALKVSGTGEAGLNTSSTTILPAPKSYKSLNVVCAIESTTDSPGEVYITVNYVGDSSAKFSGADYGYTQRVNNAAASTLTTDQISYVVDSTDRNNTAGVLMISGGSYTLSDAYCNMYIPVYTLPLDAQKKVESITVTATRQYNCFNVIAMSAEKVTLAEVIETLEVTDENYKDVEAMLKELPTGDLTSEQEEKLEVIRKQILFFNQEYVPFDIDSFKNSTVFASKGTPASSVTPGDYITAGSNIAVLNKEGWENEKDINGLVYAANGIPFDVNTNGSILFGAKKGSSVEINIEDGNYDSISALLGYTNLNPDTFEMKVVYTDGETTVDADWDIQGYHYTKNPFTRGNKEHIKDSDSYFGFSNPTLRNQDDPTQYTVFNTQYYFPVVTLDVDKNRVVDKVVFTNRDSYVDIALLGLTGSKMDSAYKTLTRVFNSTMFRFSDEEIEAAHTAYVNSYNLGLYTNKTYGIEPMDIAYLKYNENVLSGKVMSYVNENNDYTVIALVLNADGSFADVEIMGSGTANLSSHYFSKTIVLEEGQKLNVLLWENFATLKPYMTAKVVK